jgi:hypothetical protein
MYNSTDITAIRIPTTIEKFFFVKKTEKRRKNIFVRFGNKMIARIPMKINCAPLVDSNYD